MTSDLSKTVAIPRGRITDPSQVYVVIAAFNEDNALAAVVAPLVASSYSVVVVDDGSSDDTAKVARRAGAHVLSHPMNRGQGAALQTGIDYALQSGAQFVVTFDADGQHDHNDIASSIGALQRSGAEIALGSRFLGTATGLTMAKRLTLKAAIAFTNFRAGLKLTDAHNGFRVLTSNAARELRISQNRMAHASEIIEQIATKKISYIEVPVTITYSAYSRRKGQRISNVPNIIFDLLLRRFGR